MNCIRCGKQLDGHTNLEDRELTPKDGDLSICIYCGKVTVFDKGNLRNLTQEEEETLPDEIRREIERIEEARGVVIENRSIR